MLLGLPNTCSATARTAASFFFLIAPDSGRACIECAAGGASTRSQPRPMGARRRRECLTLSDRAEGQGDRGRSRPAKAVSDRARRPTGARFRFEAGGDLRSPPSGRKRSPGGLPGGLGREPVARPARYGEDLLL